MDSLILISGNLLSPIVLAFLLGIIATLVKSDLKFPDQLYASLSIYLLLAIGMKGGVELTHTSLGEFWAPAVLTLFLGVCIPIWSYVILRKMGRFERADAAAIAAHYGSVSAVTFLASLNFLESAGESSEGFMPTLVAILEIPAIVVALLIAKTRIGGAGSFSNAMHEVIAGKSILLLLGGLVIGVLAGEQGFEKVKPFFVDPFAGALTLFLLELGMITARRLRELKKVGLFLIGFGIIVPVLHAILAIALATAIGMSVGGSFVLGILAASASYIAAPAAVRIALPEANPSYYLTASLAITFPFNLTIGIPLYFWISTLLHS